MNYNIVLLLWILKLRQKVNSKTNKKKKIKKKSIFNIA
jgi:hypothetical protein